MTRRCATVVSGLCQGRVLIGMDGGRGPQMLMPACLNATYSCKGASHEWHMSEWLQAGPNCHVCPLGWRRRGVALAQGAPR